MRQTVLPIAALLSVLCTLLPACRGDSEGEVLSCGTGFTCADGFECRDGACIDPADVLEDAPAEVLEDVRTEEPTDGPADVPADGALLHFRTGIPQHDGRFAPTDAARAGTGRCADSSDSAAYSTARCTAAS